MVHPKLEIPFYRIDQEIPAQEDCPAVIDKKVNPIRATVINNNLMEVVCRCFIFSL